jgi:hypothetical protein
MNPKTMKKYFLPLIIAIISLTSFNIPLKPDFFVTKHSIISGQDYAFVIFYKIQGVAFVSTIFSYNQSDFSNSSQKGMEYALVAWARNSMMDATGNADIAKMNYQIYNTSDLSYPANKLDKFTSERTNAIVSAKTRYNPVTIVNVPTNYAKGK